MSTWALNTHELESIMYVSAQSSSSSFSSIRARYGSHPPHAYRPIACKRRPVPSSGPTPPTKVSNGPVHMHATRQDQPPVEPIREGDNPTYRDVDRARARQTTMPELVGLYPCNPGAHPLAMLPRFKNPDLDTLHLVQASECFSLVWLRFRSHVIAVSSSSSDCSQASASLQQGQQ
jgi:hypothetical protein